MPIGFRQAGNLFIAGPNINIYPSGSSGFYAISGQAGGGGGGGTAVTGLTSSGTGNVLVFSTVTNNNTVLVQKSISAGTGVAILESSDGTLTFSATSVGGSGTIISGTNVGSGVNVFSGVAGTNMVFRTLKAGPNTGVYLSGNDIIFSATTGSINGITAVTNVGGGIAVASAVTAGALVSRTISGSNGIEAVESGSLVLIRPSTNLTPNRFVYAGTGGALLTNDFFQLDSTVGTAAIGFTSDQGNVTSRLLIAQGTAAISQIRLTPFAARYTGATAGDITYNTTSGNSLFFNKSTSSPTPFIFKDNNYSLTSSTGSGLRIVEADTSGTLSNNRNLITFGVFNSITSTTISGTSELSVINTGTTVLIGTNILNSSTNSLNPQLITGKKYRFNAKGTITTSATSAGNIIARMELGSVLVASSTTALQTSISSKYFEIDCTFTIRSQGASGTVVGSGKMLTDNQYLSTVSPIISITSLGSKTINTTVNTPFDFTLQNSSQAQNIYVINEATLEYLN
jgi:hypothetical protein